MQQPVPPKKAGDLKLAVSYYYFQYVSRRGEARRADDWDCFPR